MSRVGFGPCVFTSPTLGLWITGSLGSFSAFPGLIFIGVLPVSHRLTLACFYRYKSNPRPSS